MSGDSAVLVSRVCRAGVFYWLGPSSSLKGYRWPLSPRAGGVKAVRNAAVRTGRRSLRNGGPGSRLAAGVSSYTIVTFSLFSTTAGDLLRLHGTDGLKLINPLVSFDSKFTVDQILSEGVAIPPN